MKSFTASIIWYMAVIIWTSSFVTSDDDALYKIVQQEKQIMMMQVQQSLIVTQKSCQGLCVESWLKRDVTKCNCDANCVDYGDCCLDYWQSCNASFIKAYNQERIFKCIIANLKLSNKTIIEAISYFGYVVVTRCPAFFNNLRIKNGCEKPDVENEHVIPFVEGKDGRTYRNQYCAECNNIFEYRRWNTRLKCPKSSKTFTLVETKLANKSLRFTDEERKQIRESCYIKMDPPQGVEKSKCTITTECSDIENENYKKCKVYKQQIYSMQQPLEIFKNPHCAKCNQQYLFFLSAMKPWGAVDGGSSLGLLFDFTKSSEIYGLKEIQTEHTCNEGEIYDYQIKECRKKRVSIIDYQRPQSNGSIIVYQSNWTCAFDNETFPNSSAYFTIYPNLSVYVPSHNAVYKVHEYHWYNGSVTVCGNLTVSYLKVTVEKLGKLYTKAESYITFIGLTLSIVALLAVIFTYFLFAELRSKLPGKIVINLAVALMLAQLVFLIDMFSEVKGEACVTIAVLLQFLYLAAFCWMNVMAFDVSRTFAGKSHRSHSGSRNKVFILCLIYAWGLPLLITGLTLIVNHSKAMNVAYGNNYYCWITNPIAMVIFFVIPVILMLLFNIIALVRVLVAVRRVRKVTKKVRDQSTAGQDARMCWKLTAVFGLTWILCLAAEHHIVLRIIYIIFNSLQGVFIMIGFIMTKRVLNMYLKKAGKEPLTTTSGSTQKSTLSRYEPSRKTSGVPLAERKASSAPLVDQKPSKTPCKTPAHNAEGKDDSPDAELISSMEGPETRL